MSMKYLSIGIVAKSPLSIRSDHASSGAEMTNYIPGTTLIGSLATTYKLMYPEDARTFERLFLSGEVSFPHLYLASFKEDKEDKRFPDVNEKLPIYPTPKTALTCKRHKGFLYSHSSDNEGHGVRDTLITRAIFNEWPSEDKISALPILNAIRECPFKTAQGQTCGEPTDRYDNYYRRIAHKRLLASDSQKHLQTHTGINRLSGTVEEGILYNRQVFDEETRFLGVAKIEDEGLLTTLNTFIAEIGSSGIARLGTGRTRGMGKVTMIAGELAEEPADFATFQQRLDKFDDLLQKEANRYTAQLSHSKDHYYFALTLHSPVILKDDLLRYHGTISAETLEKLVLTQTSTQLEGLQQVYQLARIQRITGWQELWGTPRANEYALEAGSVFLFKCPRAQRERLQTALYQLEEQGIGKRRLEGFGRVHISDRFHREVEWL
jgi:CRISPR-associated protein Csx10